MGRKRASGEGGSGDQGLETLVAVAAVGMARQMTKKRAKISLECSSFLLILSF